MRIIQIINSFATDLGGAERIARWLHLGMLDRGIDAHIIALESCDLGGVECSHSLALASPRDPRAMARLDGKLRELTDDRSIIHAHLFPTILWVSALRQMGRIASPLAMTEHSTDNRRRRTPPGRALDRGIYRGMDQIAAISTGTKEALATAYPHITSRIQVIENGSPLKYAVPPARAAQDGPVRLISVGRLRDAKNLEVLLAALAKIADQDWRYTIVGDGPLRVKLESLACDLNIADRVTFAGQVDDPYPWLEQADVFLMPSRWEGFGLAAVEAMNAGLPCVVSNVPGLSGVVGDGAMPPVAPDDVAGLAAAISRLISDPALRTQIANAGFARSLAFGQGRMIDQYLAFWRSLGQERPS